MLSQTVSELFFVLHELFGNTGQYYERVYHPHLSRGAVGITKVEILCLHACVSETIREEDNRHAAEVYQRQSGKKTNRHAAECVSETIREERQTGMLGNECVSETIREEDKQACWHECVSRTIREEDKTGMLA